ncbi:pyridoxal phosphate-dependent decarboxylase family protein [Rhodanobacter ginsengisoli]|uniref:Pyridoxal phosphate-dependent decarboxylase family protein n=1 Tax=Rhodanobacter ginsengisoli TaxID=418646 RepID=A0ABW0QIS4_9GAMM
MSLLTEGASLADAYLQGRAGRPVNSTRGLDEFERWLGKLDLHAGTDPLRLARDTLEWMASCGVHSDHPRYFGLFNPPALVEGVLGDLIVGVVNPQLAVVEHAPVAAAIEKRLINEFGALIGWTRTVGHFTSGGSEANHTALLAALVRRYPQWAEAGVPRYDRRPGIYASEHAHLAWIKLARMAGLGADAVRLIPAANDLRMRAADLRRALNQEAALDPVLIVGTAGTTAHGAIDDLSELADVARDVGAHFHVDAAWAGAGLIVPELISRYAGIDRADSVTIDAHKWLAVPMGAGMYLAQDEAALARAFAVTTDYMPPSSTTLQPYVASIQWSRRFIGLKLFLALGSRGLDGYAITIRRQVAMGDMLRAALVADGWKICNHTWLPLICFCGTSADSQSIADDVVQSGEAWISTVALRGRPVLRACITSPDTGESEIERLVTALSKARERAQR